MRLHGHQDSTSAGPGSDIPGPVFIVRNGVPSETKCVVAGLPTGHEFRQVEDLTGHF